MARKAGEPYTFGGAGYKAWAIDGLLHREDGPAVVFDNDNGEDWYCHGKFHRTDGPARISKSAKEWWLYGEKVNCTTQEEFERLMRLKAFW